MAIGSDERRCGLVQRGERSAKLRRQILIRQDALQGCLAFGLLFLRKDCVFEHCWGDLCTFAGVTECSGGLHERVHAARGLSYTPE